MEGNFLLKKFRCIERDSTNFNRFAIKYGHLYFWEDEDDLTDENGCTEEEMLDAVGEGFQSIYEIVRLSDNVSFKIGDAINKYGTIKRLRVVPGGSFGKLYQFSCEENNGWIDLYTIPKEDHFEHQKRTIESHKMILFNVSDEQLLLLL